MAGFFDELRRRRVARTAAIYAVVAWAVIEAASVILPALQVPEWTVTFVVVMALLGFPAVLVLSWLFDLTPGGVVRTPGKETLPPAETAALGHGRVLDFIVIAVLLGVIGWLGWERAFDHDQEATAVALDSIAVLPFTNMSGDPENEYFGDGLAEELLNALVQVGGLRVAARTSSFEYKGQNVDVRRIGEALDVATVLEGSVRRSGDRVRVTAQLIRTEDGFHLWSETYDRTMQDIFALQDEISLSIVDALRVTLGTGERERVTTHSTTNVAALEAYMRGRFEMNRRTGASLRRAVEHFEAAIATDPEYARAYSGLADTWTLMSGYAGVEPVEANVRGEEYARRALELDPDLAEAHASLGFVLFNKGDFEESIPHLERATELNPSYSPAFHWLGLSYGQVGRLQDRRRALERAVEIDPQYLTAKLALASAYRNLGRHADAEVLLGRILREYSADPKVHYFAAEDAWRRGERVEAFRRMVRAVELAPQDASLRGGVSGFLLRLGDYERAAEQIELVAQSSPEHSAVRQFPLNLAYATLDPEAVAAAVQVVDGWAEGLGKDNTLCGLAYNAGRAELAYAHCLNVLAYYGWAPGGDEPLPPAGVNPAAVLMLIAQDEGDAEAEATLLAALRAHSAALEQAGLNAFDVRWIDMLIDVLAGDDPSPFLEVLPEVLARGNFQVNAMRNEAHFRQLHGDPRFEAIVDDQLAQLAAAREITDDIAIPPP